MPDQDSGFLVNPYNEPIVIKIMGKASFQNAAPINDFFKSMLANGKRHFVLDFNNCTGMDSTFLGILAGAGIELMKAQPKGQLTLCRLGQRNLELVRNLGLHRIMTVDDEGAEVVGVQAIQTLNQPADKAEINNARMVLQAHENLVEIDESNRTKFQDVIAFLKNQMDTKP